MTDDEAYHEPAMLHATLRELRAEIDRLREELQELRSDLPYVLGWNAGYEHAKSEAAALAEEAGQ